MRKDRAARRSPLDAAIAARGKKSSPQHGARLPQFVACWDCGLRHRLPTSWRQALASAEGFLARHVGHRADWLERPGLAGLLMASNADIKLAYQALQTMTTTNLQSLASSPTAGWQGAGVDNSASLYSDLQVSVLLSFANTAPANSKGAMVWLPVALESGAYSTPATGSEGSITLPDITTTPNPMPFLGFLPYNTADETMRGVFFASGALRGAPLAPFWALAIANHSGAALDASGNVVKYAGVFSTVI